MMSRIQSWPLASLLASCLFAAAAHAASTEPANYLQSALQAYERLDYEEALEQLQRAKATSPSTENMVRIGLMEGVVFANMGLWERSNLSFLDALHLDPQSELPVAVSPKLKQSFEELRVQARRDIQEKKKKEAEAARLEAERKRAESAAQSQPSFWYSAREQAWIPAAAGAAVAVAGGISYAMSKRTANRLRDDPNPQNIDTTLALGRRQERLGVILMGVGLAGAAGAGALYLWGPKKSGPTPQVTLGFGSDGGGILLRGSLP